MGFRIHLFQCIKSALNMNTAFQADVKILTSYGMTWTGGRDWNRPSSDTIIPLKGISEAPFRREPNRSASFRGVPQSGTLKGETLKSETLKEQFK